MSSDPQIEAVMNRPSEQENQPPSAIYQKSDDIQNQSNQNQQYGQVNQMPMLVNHHYPPGGSFPNFSYQQQQQVAYAQAQFYPQPHQQIPLPMTPSSAPQLSQQIQHMTPQQQLPIGTQQQPPPPLQIPTQSRHQHQQHQQHQSHQSQSATNSPTSQFQTPQRNMVAPPIPGSATSTSSRKHSTPAGTPESQRKKPRRSDHSIPGDEGDQELKTLAHKALDVPLEELAAEVRTLETRPSSTPDSTSKIKPLKFKPDNNKERQKQVFAMTWLLRACDTSSNAVVPRNRIYARYVGICADNGLKPLSPASFGKLVRLLYPSLTTRRLGMRGQSKYHYCGLKLIGDDDNTMTPITSNGNTPMHNPSFDSSYLPGTPYGSNSPASFNSQVSTPILSNANTTSNSKSTSSANILTITNFINNHVAPGLKFTPGLLDIIERSAEAGKPLVLPDIKHFLPPSTDADIADTLYGLYKSHCTSIFESLRYMQLKKLFSLLASFHTNLTAPVSRLYVSPQVLPWIIACDEVMYKSIIKMLAKLALQDIPASVLQQLKQVSQTYTEKVSSSLTTMPVKLVLGKLELAKQFAHLISRLVRVAETAQTANKVLSNELDRDLMYNDWVKFVNIEQIASKELPCDGENYKKAIQILSTKIPEFLKEEVKDNDSAINYWGNYISSLPEQFVDVPPRLFLLCTSALLTSALREISLAGGAGFGAWWVLRCWVDEWIGWCAELGGFISEDSSTLLPEATTLTNSSSNGNNTNGKENNNEIEAEDQDLGENGKNDADEEVEVPVDLLDGQFGNFMTNSNSNSSNKSSVPEQRRN